MANKITADLIDASIIYEGGGITEILADELDGNPIAIRQLINQHNLIAKDVRNKEQQIQSLNAENEYLKTGPFVSIIAAIVNIVGSVIIGLATETIGNEDTASSISSKSIVVLCAGVLLVIVGSFATILYPKAREWYNKKPSSSL